MTVVNVLGYVYRCNGQLKVTDDQLVLIIKSKYLTQELKDTIARHKPALMDYLIQRGGLFPGSN